MKIFRTILPKIWTVPAALCLGLFFSLLVITRVSADEATTLWPTITTSNGATIRAVSPDDAGYSTEAVFNAGDTVTLTSETAIGSLYICFNNREVAPWSLTLEDGSTQECGTNGYLHEYVVLNTPSKTVTLTMGADNTKIVKFIVLSEGERPAKVQDWSPSCTNADILLVSSHADDEILFFGGILPYYAGELNLSVQLVYFTNYWNGATVREHEKLDGLWTVGVRNYPVNGNFDDVYSTDLETAKGQYNYDNAVGFMVEMIRRFKPLVMVGQDLNGEYGHGCHMLTAAAIADAVQISMDADAYPESVETYGVYDVPKTYLHLYPENSIDLDCRRALTNFGGKTVLEVAAEGYLQHISQQWCWFYVMDDKGEGEYANYQYSCGRFGLYRTTVGNDTSADLLCNLTTYEELARIAEEESRSIAESEAASEAESVAASIAESQSVSEAESVAASISEAEALLAKEKATNRMKIILIIVVAVVALLLLVAIFLILRSRLAKPKRRKKRKTS